MSTAPARLSAFVITAWAVVVGSHVVAQSRDAARFGPPKRVQAANALLGADRPYPSPVFHDVDGDGLADLVVGDLRGIVTFARRLPGAEVAFAAEQPLTTRDGKPLKFHNW